MSRSFVAAPTQREFWTGERCFGVDLHNDDASLEASLAVARVERGVTTEFHWLVGACKRDIVRNGQGILRAVIRGVRQRRSGSGTPATAISNSSASAHRGAVRGAVSMWKPRDRHSLNALRPTCAASSADNGTAAVGPAVNQKWSINIATRFAGRTPVVGPAPRWQAPSSDRHRRRLNPTCHPRRPSHTEQR
jgi:hypothetical protein